MLRITTTHSPDGATVGLEGRLAGPWVDELAACWKALAADRDVQSIRVQLNAVTFIDAAGKRLLRTMHAHGTILVAEGCMIRATVDEITHQTRDDGANTSTKGDT